MRRAGRVIELCPPMSQFAASTLICVPRVPPSSFDVGGRPVQQLGRQAATRRASYAHVAPGSAHRDQRIRRNNVDDTAPRMRRSPSGELAAMGLVEGSVDRRLDFAFECLEVDKRRARSLLGTAVPGGGDLQCSKFTATSLELPRKGSTTNSVRQFPAWRNAAGPMAKAGHIWMPAARKSCSMRPSSVPASVVLSCP